MLYADPFLTVYCCLLAALLGACMGSFLNCAAWRIVHGESVLRGRSHCDACGHVLTVRDLIPVVSYLAAHGRCRYCGAKLSRRHVLAEAVSALVLPSTEVFTRELVMPAMTEQQLLYNLPYEFRDYLTEEKNKYFFDYSMREVLRDESGQPTEMNLLACATLKGTVESYRTMLRRAGFRLRVLTPSECAYSAVLQAYYRRTQQEGRDLCVVNLGHSATFLYIYRGGHFASRREIEVGMSDLDHLVADQCSVDVHVAHEYVRQNYNHVLESEQARELYGRIAVEVVKAVNFFNYNNRERELTQLCLCGGGSAIQPLYDTIADTTGMTLHTSAELLGQRMSTEEPWMYLRAIGGVDLGIKGGLR